MKLAIFISKYLKIRLQTANKNKISNRTSMRLICDESSMATYKFLEVVGGSLSDGVDVINKPGHTEPVQLLVEEVNSQLP